MRLLANHFRRSPRRPERQQRSVCGRSVWKAELTLTAIKQPLDLATLGRSNVSSTRCRGRRPSASRSGAQPIASPSPELTRPTHQPDAVHLRHQVARVCAAKVVRSGWIGPLSSCYGASHACDGTQSSRLATTRSIHRILPRDSEEIREEWRCGTTSKPKLTC